jgi:hypothetical protein
MQRHPTYIPGSLALSRKFSEIARHKTWSVVVVGLLVLIVRAALIPVVGIPAPEHHDEFGYLLSGDTFFHGRLTNPPHPMWIHFESFHIIQHPTYSSIYPPAQGVVLAVGEFLGKPWIGQLLVTALMCSTICWMLQGWFPPKWALYGALLVVLRIGVLRYWVNGYWSASAVALGAALVLGALPRIKKKQRILDSILMAVGITILANSRPFEGFVLCLTIAIALLVWMTGARRPVFKVTAVRVVAPLAIVLIAAAVATGYFYYRVTGSPLKMIYQVDSTTYNPVPYFLWQTPRSEPAYHHAVMQAFYEQDLYKFNDHRTLRGFFSYLVLRISEDWSFYLGGLLTLPLLTLPWTIHDRRMRFPLIACVVFLIALMSETWGMPHYAAPALGLLMLVVVQCARRLGLWTWHKYAVGLLFVQAIPLLLFATVIVRVSTAAAHPGLQKTWPRGNLERAEILKQIEQMPGKHLILVRYSPQHDLKIEWVYNGADIDGSKVVWSRDMGARDNQELLQYFSDRTAWVLEADETPPKLYSYLAAH